MPTALNFKHIEQSTAFYKGCIDARNGYWMGKYAPPTGTGQGDQRFEYFCGWLCGFGKLPDNDFIQSDLSTYCFDYRPNAPQHYQNNYVIHESWNLGFKLAVSKEPILSIDNPTYSFTMQEVFNCLQAEHGKAQDNASASELYLECRKAWLDGFMIGEQAFQYACQYLP